MMWYERLGAAIGLLLAGGWVGVVYGLLYAMKYLIAMKVGAP